MFKNLATLSILAFAALFEPLEAIAQQAAAQPPQAYYGYGPWHMWNDGYGWHFWWVFPAMMLFFLLVCGAMFLFGHRLCGHGLSCRGSHATNRTLGDPTHSALQILNEHFARGEIQKDEYVEKKTAILSNGRT
jgi:putative membrane protein